MPKRLLLVLLVLGPLGFQACGSFGRKVNQGLPEWMRSEPGQEEKERLVHVRKRVESTPEEKAARAAAFAAAKADYDAGRWEDAGDKLEDFLKEFPASEFDEEGRFLWGEARYHDDEPLDAYAAYKSYALNYPVTNRSSIIEERIYEMGKDYIEGKHAVFLGIFSNVGRGEDMLGYLVSTFPNSDRADDAQWALAQFYTDDENWPKAVIAYDLLVKQYPTSEFFPAARYYSAYTRYRRVKGNYYDQDIVREARERFTSYLTDFPTGQWHDDAERITAELDKIASEKLLLIGDWYASQGKPYSARYYYLRCKTLFPSQDAGATAAARYAEVADAVPEGDEAAVLASDQARARAEQAAAESRAASAPAPTPDSQPNEGR